MNSGDWIDLTLITDRAIADPEVKCWITGESRPIRRVAGLPTESPLRVLRNAILLLLKEDGKITSIATFGLVAGIASAIASFFS
jgi:hypothetical protein